MLQIRWSDKICNEKVLQCAGKERKWKYLDYIRDRTNRTQPTLRRFVEHANAGEDCRD